MLLLVGVKGKFKLSNWGHCNENRLVRIIGGTGIEAMNEWQLYGGRNCTDGLTRNLTVASVGTVPKAVGREGQADILRTSSPASFDAGGEFHFGIYGKDVCLITYVNQFLYP